VGMGVAVGSPARCFLDRALIHARTPLPQIWGREEQNLGQPYSRVLIVDCFLPSSALKMVGIYYRESFRDALKPQ
jgi:hypothetical protein